ncbi:permease [Sulfolobales archaeon HS-7]|nr:permease [Sulfolobales archaeon HS-7]
MFWVGFRGLTSKKGVAILAILAVAIGIGGVVGLVSLTQGISKSILSDIDSLGPSTILIQPTEGHVLTQATVDEILSFPYVTQVYPLVLGVGSVEIGGQLTTVTIIGINNLTAFLGQVILSSGSIYPVTSAPVAVIGYQVANPLPGISISPGEEVIISLSATDSVPIRVVGVLSPSGFSPLTNAGTSVFMSLQAAMDMLDRNTYSAIFVKVNSVNDVNKTASVITAVLGNSVSVTTVQQIVQTVSSITSGLGILLTGTASISLVVGGVGIAATQLTKVYQRIREIGIMKTIGMKTHDVLGIFLAEAIMIGLIGGVLGILGGIALSDSFPLFLGGSAHAARRSTGVGFSIHPVISVESIILAFLVALVLSIIAGIYPAWRAAKLTAIEAIRRE